MTRLLVTIQAIIGYLKKAKEAKEQLDDANERMKCAAEQLCSVWQGQSAQAFAEEQGVLHTWVSQLSSVGDEYMDLLSKTANRYAEAEQAAANAIKE